MNIEDAIILEDKSVENTYNWADFESLEIYSKEEIEAAAYKDFLLKSNAVDNKIMKNIFEKSKKSLILKIMEEYKISKGIKSTEEIIENKVSICVEDKEISNEIVGEYVSVTDFIVEVSKMAKQKNIEFDLINIVPVFKLFGEYENKDIKITFNEKSKQGTIFIK